MTVVKFSLHKPVPSSNVYYDERWRKKDKYSLLKTILTILLAAVFELSVIYLAWNQQTCEKETSNSSLKVPSPPLFQQSQCSSPPPLVDRFDCWPEFHGASKDKCEARGCCWLPTSTFRRVGEAPWCYFPSNYSLYTVQSVLREEHGLTARILVNNRPSGFPHDVTWIRLDVIYDTNTRLHFKLYDLENERYEVPVQLAQDQPVTAEDIDYNIEIPDSGPFYITVTRKSSGKILFSSQSVAPLIFSDQFIQFGTQLSSKFIYGLGEHMDKFAISTQWNRLVLYSHDEPPTLNANLYGSHPFYLNIEEDHNAHGVFLLNSNAMEIELQESPALTYRTTGGILDFYIFTGPTPDSVVEQYTGLIGRSFMPPYWALGFHLCRWGYGSSDELKKVIKRMREAGIPYDTQWTDIDYMHSHLDWTYDDDEGKYAGLPEIVKDLHEHGQHYIPIIDPGISNTQARGRYPPYDEGITKDVFIKTADGSQPIDGMVWPGSTVSADFFHPNATDYLTSLAADFHQFHIMLLLSGLYVWPGSTVFPDFFHPNATDYWTSLAADFHQEIPYDGLWIDMNEPSDFRDGSTKGCPSNNLEDPPFVPVGLKGGTLRERTICASAKQYPTTHYNLHSLYGHSESVVTKRALDTVLGNKRSIVISRSTYPTTGVHAGHWLGDNKAEWEHAYYSITGIMSFQLFGIPLVGADICGFTGNTNTELCTRWMQLGAFYPFMRNHNSLLDRDQDPAYFDPMTQERMRIALNLRYKMLPYLYTLFYQSHVNGTAIVRPLFFQYPGVGLYDTDEQFMWGDGLLVTPALKKGVSKVTGYLPKDRWYDYFNESSIDSQGQYASFDVPMDHISMHIRGGCIIPTQKSEVTTTLGRQNKFTLLVAMSSEMSADGQLYWDDGESRDSIPDGKFNLIRFSASKELVSSTIVQTGYSDEPMVLGEVKVFGVVDRPNGIVVNGNTTHSFSFKNDILRIHSQHIDLLTEFQIKLLY